MDRIMVSGTIDRGSNPFGRTSEAASTRGSFFIGIVLSQLNPISFSNCMLPYGVGEIGGIRLFLASCHPYGV